MGSMHMGGEKFDQIYLTYTCMRKTYLYGKYQSWHYTEESLETGTQTAQNQQNNGKRQEKSVVGRFISSNCYLWSGTRLSSDCHFML